ncbi:hypothetical protein NMY22_g6745 [Coprinellus aureogranulatus]|nr:hypothetical protein NMY22_g6745 [Coprinellus aureogranulatus]
MVKDISKMPGVNFNKLVLYGNDHGRVLKNFTVASTSLRHLAIKNSEIPESLFAGDTPQLQVLKLRECSKISWDCGIFRSEHLSHLHLECLESDSRPSSRQLTSILLSLVPSIQDLSIMYAFSDDSSGKPDGGKPMLTRLQRLKMYGDPKSCANLVKHFRMPATATVHVDMNTIQYPLRLDRSVAILFGPRFLEFFSALSNCVSTEIQLVRLSLRSEPGDGGLASLFMDGYSTGGPNNFKTSDEPTLKLSYIHAHTDLRFGGEDDCCASCGLKGHQVIARSGSPGQLVDVSLCSGCSGSCHYRPWFPMLTHEESAIPGICLQNLEVLDLELDRNRSKRFVRVPTQFWNVVARLPSLREIKIQGFCSGKFGELWMDDASSFPALRSLKFDAVAVPSILVKRLQDGLFIRQGDPDRQLETLEFGENCDGVSIEDLEGILGKYVRTLKAPKEEGLPGNGLHLQRKR